MTAALVSTTDGAWMFPAGTNGTLEEVWVSVRCTGLFRLMVRTGGAVVLNVGGRDVLFMWAHWTEAEKVGARRWARYQLGHSCPNKPVKGGIADFGLAGGI